MISTFEPRTKIRLKDKTTSPRRRHPLTALFLLAVKDMSQAYPSVDLLYAWLEFFAPTYLLALLPRTMKFCFHLRADERANRLNSR